MVPGQFPLLEPALLEQRLTDNSNNTRHESHSFWVIMCYALSLLGASGLLSTLSRSLEDTFIKHVFQSFEPFLANRHLFAAESHQVVKITATFSAGINCINHACFWQSSFRIQLLSQKVFERPTV
jgi:hypothetical protein